MNGNRSARTPWIMVTAVIIAAVVLGTALIVGDPVLIIVAVAIVVITGIGTTVLSRRAGGAISFTGEYPENTIGPRATAGGDSSPPIDTHQHPDPTPRAAAMSEVPAPDSPETPDDERVFPQHVNIAPKDRLRREHGETYIEREREDEER